MASGAGQQLTTGACPVLAVLIGIVVVVVSVIEWFGHITLPHAVAILTLIVGVSIVLGGLGDRYHTRL